MTFAERLKLLRGHLGMTQTAFAKKLGLPQNTYHRYEKGERVPDINALTKISKSLSISADELLGLNDPKQENVGNGQLHKNNGLFDSKDAIIAKQAETIVSLTRSLKKMVAKNK